MQLGSLVVGEQQHRVLVRLQQQLSHPPAGHTGKSRTESDLTKNTVVFFVLSAHFRADVERLRLSCGRKPADFRDIVCPVLLVPEGGEEEPADGSGGVAADHEEVAAGGKG